MTASSRKKLSLLTCGPYLAAFFIPVVVLIITFIENGIWPFGDNCFLRTDLYHQYAPFHQELQRKLTSGGSLFYSWNIGGGTNFWALAAYYLASPSSLLVVLFPENYVIEFITVSIVVKLSLSSVTLTYYLNKKHGLEGPEAYPAVFFGLFYALSGYTAAYNWNIMWLDCLWLFPLIIMGLEKLVRENKGLLYSVTLGFCIFTNYYISIMVCLGIACYCFFLLGTEKLMLKDFGIKLAKFIGYTLLALAFSAVFLLPYIRYFPMTASADSSFKWEWYSYFSLFDMVARHLMNVETHTGLDHWPNIYCGVAVLLFVPFYFLNRKITLREKIGYVLLLLVFYFSFSTRAMDYIWHGFHIPNSLPCRQSFIYIFILLTVCFRGFLGMKERSYRDITFVMIAALVLIFAVEKLNPDEEIYKNYVIYISALFVIFYTIILYAYRRGRVYKDILLVIALSVAALESCVNYSVTSVSTVKRTDYTSFDEGIRTIMDRIEEEDPEPFFRVEKRTLRTKNDGAWVGFPSISTFSSIANSNLTDFYKKIGMESSTNAYGSNGQTFFTNMLLNVKYSIDTEERPADDSLYELYDTNEDNVWIYRNKWVMPLGAAVDPFSFTSWSEGNTPLEAQNNLCKAVSGVDNLFLDVTPDYTASDSVTLTVPESGWYYAYSKKSGPKELQVTHGTYSKKLQNLNRSYVIDLGWCEAGESVIFRNAEKDSTKNAEVTLYLFQEDLMPEVYESFSKVPMVIDSFSDTEITAHVDAPEGSMVFTTIASEEGWEVTVDGEPIEYDTEFDAYISFPVTAGSHTIVFRYHVPWFVPSLLITLAALTVWALIFCLGKVKEKRFRKTIESIENAGITEAAPAEETPADEIVQADAADFSAVPQDKPLPETDSSVSESVIQADESSQN